MIFFKLGSLFIEFDECLQFWMIPLVVGGMSSNCDDSPYDRTIPFNLG